MNLEFDIQMIEEAEELERNQMSKTKVGNFSAFFGSALHLNITHG